MATQQLAHSIAASWGVEAEYPFEEIKPGEVYRLHSLDGRTLKLKALAKSGVLNTADRLELQHEVLVHLASCGVGVAVPICHPSGGSYAATDDHYFTLSPWLGPADPGGADPLQLFYNCGRAVAGMHEALSQLSAEDFRSRTWTNDPIAQTFEQSLPRIEDTPVLPRKEVEALVRSVEPRMRSTLIGIPEQLIHRDCHPANVVVDGNEVVGFIDCDHFSIGAPAHDIGYFLIRMTQWYYDAAAASDDWLEAMARFIDGYDRERPLADRDLSSIPYMMVYVLVMSIDYQQKQANDFEVARDLDGLRLVVANLDRMLREFERC